ncbi:MAG TPA: hypothetical protein VF181_07270 [Balneolaceae bacterium]
MGKKGKIKNDLQSASEGVGPLLQRDYWAVLRATPYSPHEVISILREDFFIFPPEELVVFRRSDNKQKSLQVGDKLDVMIRMKKPVAVRVIHLSPASITLGTVKKHPEAGRITFGSYRNKQQDVIFHIRSRARQGSALDYAEFNMIGDAMQTTTWTDYINRLAHMIGEGIIDSIHVEKQEVEQREEDETMDAPTFIAEGD